MSDFKKLMSARFLFTLATTMQAVVLGWRMYALTHDPLYLGLIGLSEAVPALGLALYAGYVVDQSRPLYVYQWVLKGSLLSAILMLVSQLSFFNFSTHLQILALFTASFVTGAARGFSQPSIFATVPRIVPREQLSQASAWMSTAMQIARVAGPALGGAIFGWIGLTTTVSVACLFLVAGIFCLLAIGVVVEPSHKSTGPLKTEILLGGKFVFSHPVLLPALMLDMISVLFGGVTALLPIYASEILKIGPKGLGILVAAPAVGAALMGFWLARKPIRKKAGPLFLSSVAGFGFCILVFSLSRNVYLSVLMLGLSGVFDSVSMVVRTVAVQMASPENMRGRISAVNSIFIGSSNEIGEFESGVAARFLGTVPAAAVGAVLCLVTVGVVTIVSPTLRKLEL
jgi:MFS family permease